MAKVAILGSGNAACTFSAYLGKAGHEVRLCDSEKFKDNLAYMMEYGKLEMTGAETGIGKISMVTTDPSKAIQGVEVIMVVVPAFAHAAMAEFLAPHLKDGQIVVLNPGAIFGALEFLNVLKACGCKADVTIAETASNMFATRRVAPGVCRVGGIKRSLHLATIPSNRVDEVYKKLGEFFNSYIPVKSTIMTSLLYTNPVLHTPITLLNTGWIETTKGNFSFYGEGLSPSVAKYGQAIDDERCALSLAMGYKSIPLIDQLHGWYGEDEQTELFGYYQNSKVHSRKAADAPHDLHSRYIHEDVPYGLVTMSEMAKVFGVPTPHMDALIVVANTCNGTDYRKQGRNLETLGLSGLNREAVIRRLTDGV